jgi:hypothetical protein
MKTGFIDSVGLILSICLVGILAILGIAGSIYFHRGKDVASKRKWLPRFVVFGCASTILVLSMFESRGSGPSPVANNLILIIPFAILFSWISIKNIKFCDKCAAINYRQYFWDSMRHCQWCGAELDAKSDHWYD